MAAPNTAVEILLVEDNPADIRLAREALRECQRPFQLFVVHDGDEALCFLRQQGPWATAPRPRLILLDLNLPKVDGRTVLLEIKADPVLRSIPVVVMTTSRATKDVAFAYEHQANCYVVKSPELGEFLHTICAIEEFWFDIAQLPAAE